MRSKHFKNDVLRTVSLIDSNTGFKVTKTRNTAGWENITLSTPKFKLSLDSSEVAMSVNDQAKTAIELLQAIIEQPCNLELLED